MYMFSHWVLIPHSMCGQSNPQAVLKQHHISYCIGLYFCPSLCPATSPHTINRCSLPSRMKEEATARCWFCCFTFELCCRSANSFFSSFCCCCWFFPPQRKIDVNCTAQLKISTFSLQCPPK